LSYLIINSLGQTVIWYTQVFDFRVLCISDALENGKENIDVVEELSAPLQSRVTGVSRMLPVKAQVVDKDLNALQGILELGCWKEVADGCYELFDEGALGFLGVELIAAVD
jgi:hypothetical protein